MAERDKLDLGQSKDKSKLLVYLVIFLIVLVLGFAGGLLYVMGVFGKKPETAQHASSHAEEAAPTPPPPPKVPTYIGIEKDFVVNFPPNSEMRMGAFGLSLLVYDPTLADAVTKHAPVLRNNIGILLASQNPTELKTVEGKLALQAKLQEEISKTLKQQVPTAQIEQVFFTHFVLQ